MSPRPSPSPPRINAFALVTVVAALAIAGCSDNKPAPNAPGGGAGSTTYEGTVSGSAISGSLTLTIATSTPGPQPGPARARGIVTASGTLVLAGGGGTVNLTGTYDDIDNLISVAGGGWSLSGGLTAFGMEGGFSGPSGTSGVFSVQQVGSGTDTVIVVVGSFTSTTGGPGGGFNFSIRGTAVHGNAFETGSGTAIPLDGTYTPGSGAISIVNPANAGGPPLATGTLQSNGSASGSYDNGAGEAGTWSGVRQ